MVLGSLQWLQVSGGGADRQRCARRSLLAAACVGGQHVALIELDMEAAAQRVAGEKERLARQQQQHQQQKHQQRELGQHLLQQQQQQQRDRQQPGQQQVKHPPPPGAHHQQLLAIQQQPHQQAQGASKFDPARRVSVRFRDQQQEAHR